MKTCALVLLLIVTPLWAGDAATFLSLGCSKDFNYYAFAQYGVQDGSGFPYAELYVVDVAQNAFVSGGAIKALWKEPDPLTSGVHVLLQSRVQADSLLQAYGVSEMLHMRPVVRVSEAQRTRAEWQGPQGTHRVELQQESRGEAAMLSSEAAFELQLTYASDDTVRIGNPQRFRDHVMRYDIDRVLANEAHTAFVFVIRKTMIGFEGPNIRYMVETVKVP